MTLIGNNSVAPKGVAALYVQSGFLSTRGRQETGMYWSAGALILGGGQEGGRSAGTGNVPYIIGLGQAEELLTSDNNRRDNADRMERMRSKLLNRLTIRLSLLPIFSSMGLPRDY